ncbi:diguanylate cyclase [Conexibacter woesei]|uniref:diguanylate cyclase n=1 Tax=Conexibacter woesei TaxID=191495 RepID=UPI0003FA7821|nr:diguanylate cyclase [Conexibacter woesei]
MSSVSDREGLLAWVFNTQDQGAVLLDGARRVLDANPAACALLGAGTARAALIGTILPDPPPVGESVRIATHPRPDGHGTLVTLSDSEAEAHTIERIAAAVQEFLFIAELGDDGGLTMRYTSRGIERLLGAPLPPGETIESTWFRSIHDDDRTATQAAVRATAEGLPTSVDYRLTGLDGRVRWIRSRSRRREEQGRVLIDGLLTDVTAEHEGDEEMARFRGVVEASGSAIALLDLDWRVRWMNPAGLAMTGLSAEDAIGTAYLELVGDEARAAHIDHERPTVERDGRWSGESVLQPVRRGPDRRPLPVDATTYRIAHPASGEPLGLACIRRDVSDLKRMAREHEAIGNLASTIAVGAGRDDIYEAACREAAHLLGADAGGIAMLSGAGPRTVGTWRAPGADDRLELAIARLGGPAAGGGPEAAAAFAGIGAIELDQGHHAAGAPVMVDGRAWGLIAACRRGPPFGAEDERALARLGALVGTAVGVATSRELLVRQATTDGLTGLLNHRAFHDTLRVEAKRAGRYGRPLAVVLADLDGFKEVNDAHGHQAGDRLLEEVARALEGVLRATEVVARLGGDEFALLLPETGVAGARATAERVRATVAALPGEIAFGVSISSGVADLAQAGGSSDDLIRFADRALYRSKEGGRDRISVHEADPPTQ